MNYILLISCMSEWRYMQFGLWACTGRYKLSFEVLILWGNNLRWLHGQAENFGAKKIRQAQDERGAYEEVN